DMSKLEIPSWMDTAPNRPGEKSHGSFTADQWRMFCTINLPITLVRLWGTLPQDERKYAILVNFMHLVTAVRLANMRVMTEARIQSYEYHMRAYLEEVVGYKQEKPLYPHTKLTTYQHMSLHFGSLLRRFGPPHSWRCFAFERFNYILRKFPTNSKFGELEQTMFNHFCMMQKLKSRLHDVNSSPEFEELSNIYRNTFEESNARGTRDMDALAFNDYSIFAHGATPTSQRLNHIVYSLLQTWINNSHFPGSAPILVHPHANVKQHGATFSPRDHSEANARVVFQTNGAEEWSAGSIKSIFTAKWTSSDQDVVKTFAEINSYLPLADSDAVHDHFRAFGFAAGHLFYDRLDENTFLVPLDCIASHFGYTPWSTSCIDCDAMHALPLNKASDFSLTFE
ncbi:hypothetical protein C8R41DRAFT_764937, partial [Lentinula lateritia]